MKASVIICTYNRHDLLKSSLKSISLQSFPRDQFEIIVVDNNSTDRTKEIVEELSTSFPSPCRYIFEEQQGLSFARNRGIQEANGDIIVFCDDDIEADRNWLAEIVSVFDDPCAAAAGGPIKPIWLSARPEWLPDSMLDYIAVSDFPNAAISGEFGLSDMPFGANIAFRKHIFTLTGLFPTHLGRIGSNLLSNEETVICRRILAADSKIKFAPNAIMGHKIDPKRLTKKWFYRRHYWQGRSNLLLDQTLKLNVYKKAHDILPQFYAINHCRNNLTFEQRFNYYYMLGYLHQLIFSGEKYNYSSIRGLFAVLNTDLPQAEHDDCHAIHNNLTTRINALTNSLSWRITAPFRAIKSKVDNCLR